MKKNASEVPQITCLTGPSCHLNLCLYQVRGGNADADVSDAFTLRIVMSLMSIHQSLESSGNDSKGLKGHIVAEVCDLDNEPLLRMVAGTHPLEMVVAHDVIGRLMIQSRRQPGLAAVWEDILGFEGNEFYAQASYTHRSSSCLLHPRCVHVIF